MAEEFETITSQEQLDSIIGERLKRERESVSKKYGDYDSVKGKNAELETVNAELLKQLDDLKNKSAEFESAIAEREATIKGYETRSLKQKVAHEVGLPYEMANRLSGESEDEILKDAQELQKIIGVRQPSAPLASSEEEKVEDPSGVRELARALSK